MRAMSDKHFVVYPTWIVGSTIDLFRKMFTHSFKGALWNDDDGERSGEGMNWNDGQGAIQSNMTSSKSHGRNGTSFHKPKRRHPSTRRDIKATDTTAHSRDKKRFKREKPMHDANFATKIQSPLPGKQIKNTWIIYTTVILISIACYSNSLHGDFVHDDLSAIKTNGDVTGQNSIWKIFFNDFWGKPMADRTSHKSYRPFTILTFRLNVFIHDLEPVGFHAFNVFLHAATCAVFVKMCMQVARTSMMCALIAGLHFATHPIHTEAVTGIVGRADVLASILVLLSFLRYNRCQRELHSKNLIVSVLLALGAMLSKEHGVTVLGINFVWDVFLHRRTITNYLWNRKMTSKAMRLFKRLFVLGLGVSSFSATEIYIYCLIGLAFLSFRVFMLRGSLPQFSDQDNPASFSPCTLTRIRTLVYLPAFNFWLLLAPINLNYDWQMGSIPLISKWADIRNGISLIFYSALLWSCVNPFWKGKPRRDVVVGLAFLIIPFIPASNLLFRVGFVVAERILYIPSLGFSLLVGTGVERIIALQKSSLKIHLTKIVLVFVLSLFAYKTWQRNQDWRSRETLFTSGLRLLPHNAKMHYNYANLQKDLGNTEKAIHHYKIALRLWPHHASAHNNLGTLLNDSAEAEAHFQQALRINPLHAHAFFNLGNLKHQQGMMTLAIRLMERSIELEPQNPDALTNLAAMYTDLDQYDKARKLHLKVLQLEPNNADHLNNYAAFLQRIGRLEDALHYYQKALLRDANHTVALLNTARLLKKLKFNDKAESLYQRALLRDDDPQTKDGLGVLYLNTGRANKAEVLFREALLHRPNDPIVKVHLAQAQVHQRKYNEAEALLLSVMTHPKASRRDILHQLATLYSQLNRTTDAVRFVQLALRTCSQSDLTCAPLHAFHGDLSKDLHDLDSAVTSYKLAVQLLIKFKSCCRHNRNVAAASIATHVHLNLGAIYHVKGQYEKAWQHYKMAMAQDPSNKVLLQNMEKLKKAELRHKNSSCHQQERFNQRKFSLRHRHY